MPRHVDHAARRRAIAEALWRIVRDRGLDAVTLREVALEASISMGLVQHYFRTKDEMLLFALSYLNELNEERIRRRIASIGASPSSYDITRACLLEMLPLAEESRIGLVIGTAYFAKSLSDPQLAEAVRTAWPPLHQFITELLGKAVHDGSADPGIDPTEESAILLALVDGLAGQCIAGQISPDHAVRLVDHQLHRLFRMPSGH